VKFKVILNPVAGKGKALDLEPSIAQCFRERKLDFTIVLTTAVMDAADLAERALEEGYDCVVAAGGDGTCNEVLNGLMRLVKKKKQPPHFAVLPVGRGNDFSYGVELPGSLKEAFTVMAESPPRPLDVGRIAGGFYPEGRYFGNGIGIGFDTIVGLEASKLKHVQGFAAYVIGAAKTFFLFPMPPEVTVSYGEQSITCRATQISILNGKRMGGTFFMAPDGRSDDGLLDICMTRKALNRREMANLIIRYTKGTQAGHPAIITGRSTSFSIHSPSGSLVCHADGETICTDGTHLDVTIMAGALSILAPPSKGAIL
jgi:diacylglycerol kinase (ATP)